MNMVVFWLTIGVCSFVVQDLFVSSLNVTRVESFLNESASINISFSPRKQSLTLWDVNYGQKQSMITCFGDPCKCNTTGFLSNEDLYTLTCSSSFVNVTVKHMTLEQHGEQWRYSSVPENDEQVSILCANVGDNSLTAIQTQDVVGSDKFAFNENDLVLFHCRTLFCFPNTTVTLHLNQTAENNIYISPKNQSYFHNNSLSHINATFEVTVNRSFNAWTVRCIATSLWTKEQVWNSRWYFLNIQYPPDRPPTIQSFNNGSVYKIIENKEGFLVCSVGKSNPPAELKWDITKLVKNITVIENSNGTVSTLRWTASRNINSKITCMSNHTSSHPQNVYVYADNLYPPEEIKISSTTSPNHDVFNNITIIENTFLKLFCSARSNPEPAFFEWSGLNTSKTSEVYIHGSKATQGNITCFAENVMIEFPENKTTYGTNSKTIHVDVLYPPDIFANSTHTVIEGNNIYIICTNSPGWTSQQSIEWMKNQEHITFNNSLTIENVTRQHSGNYACFVNYSMIPTYGDTKTEVLARGLYIDVQYKPEISNFFADEIKHNMSVTVNESDNVRMVCIADSNPKSTIQIYFANNTLISQENTTTLEHLIHRTRCTDTGNYICSAYNLLNTNGQFSSRTLHLLVNCSPRLSPNIEIQQNITTSQQGSAIFSFVAVAFPRPHFKWFRKTNSTILEANNGFTTVQNISENEMRIYFIVTNVALTDFGEYMLTINNTLGGYQQSYFLREQAQISGTTDVAEVVPLGITAGVATGSVITTLMIVAVVYSVHKRFRRKQQNQLNNSSEHREILQYQNISTDGISTCNVSCSPNIYEGLQAMGTDQQYLELSALDGNNKAGRNNVYANLPHRTTE